jgi:hypothetical protein
MPDKTHPGRFQAGHDPRRHVFTREECLRGYEAACASLLRRFPGCDPHFLMCAIMGSKAGYGWPTPESVTGLSEEEMATKFARF